MWLERGVKEDEEKRNTRKGKGVIIIIKGGLEWRKKLEKETTEALNQEPTLWNVKK